MDIYLLLKDFQGPQRVFLTTEMLNWLIQTTRKYQNLMGVFFKSKPVIAYMRKLSYWNFTQCNTIFIFIYALSCFPCGRQHTLCCFGWLCISFCIWADDALLGFFVFLWVATHYLSLSDLLIVSSGQDCICLAPINMYFTFFLSIWSF